MAQKGQVRAKELSTLIEMGKRKSLLMKSLRMNI